MSYILDALKKAARERQCHTSEQEYEPFLSPRDSENAPPQPRLTFRLFCLLSLAILVGAGLLLLPRASDQPRVFTEAPPGADRDQWASKAPAGKPPASRYPLPAEQSVGRQDMVSEESRLLPEQPPLPADKLSAEPPLLATLPFNIRSSLPDMQFSGHVYAAQPSQRMIMINQLILREHEYLTETLQVHEITRSGITFKYGNNYFRVVLF